MNLAKTAASLLLVLGAATSAGAADESVLISSADSDSLEAETRLDTGAAADTSSGEREGGARVEDPVQAWRHWKQINRAIALDELDGPDDILAKEEIIEDRIDDLTEEDARLQQSASEWEARYEATSVQLEVLDDLAEMQLGGDLQLQQRIEDVREQIREAAQWLERIGSSREDLALEVASMRKLAAKYRQTAEEIRTREEGHR